MFALVDCNNFYASCERVFQPWLHGKPVIVLSNNDGCVVSRSNEAKALGIKMAVPYFQVSDIIKAHDVKVFSSNYTLYGDMSRRVMNVLSSLVPRLEVYSIDEAFADFRGMHRYDLPMIAGLIRERVLAATDIPVSVGIAPTKSLAKMANKMAKKLGGICMIDTEEKRIEALRNLPLSEVWGIGAAHHARLCTMGKKTALDFALMPQGWAHANISVVLERLHQELNGVPCLDMHGQLETKKSICTSLSFGKGLSEFGPVSEAIANHAHRCAEKLRAQKSACWNLNIFLNTDVFKPELGEHYPNHTITLPSPCNASPRLVCLALQMLKHIWRDGYTYKKAGVIVTGLVPENCRQLNLFAPHDDRHDRVSQAMDTVNQRYGKDVLRVGAMGYSKQWRLRQESRSNRYTTRWDELPRVH